MDRLDLLRHTDGILGVYLNEPLRYYLQESAQLVNTARAWNDLGVTGKGVTVAILDTGVDFGHPDLADAMRANVKLVGFGDPLPVIPVQSLTNSDTSSGHGTHVAGDVASRGTASDGAYRGLAPGAGLVGIGAGDALNMFLVLEGLEWTRANRDRYGIRVINNSWGSQFESFDRYDPVNQATRALAEAGVVVVFANGNDGTEMSMNPYAAPPWVLPVAAGDKKGKVADFSSGGIEADTVGLGFAAVDVAGETRGPLNMGLYHPAVTTTGVDVVSTRANNTIIPVTALPRDARSIPPESLPYYTTLSGTSMAAPETAGVVALVLEAAPELSPSQVRMVLQVTARPIPDTPFHSGGYGYTDASAAVDLALSLRGRGAGAIQAEPGTAPVRPGPGSAGRPGPSRPHLGLERPRPHPGRLPGPPGHGARRHRPHQGGDQRRHGALRRRRPLRDHRDRRRRAARGQRGRLRCLGRHDPRRRPVQGGRPRLRDLDGGDLRRGLAGDPVHRRRRFGGQAAPERARLYLRSPGGTVHRLPRVRARGAPGAPLPAGERHGPSRPGASGLHPCRVDPGREPGQRAPERRLAAAFGLASTLVTPPRFVSAPLPAPLTLGDPAAVRVWVQGPSEEVQGLISGELLVLAPDGTVEDTVIGQIPAKVKLSASSVEPLLTEAPVELAKAVTVPAGHRIALSLAVSFIGTSAHTLYFDSGEYPSGLRPHHRPDGGGAPVPGARPASP